MLTDNTALYEDGECFGPVHEAIGKRDEFLIRELADSEGVDLFQLSDDYGYTIDFAVNTRATKCLDVLLELLSEDGRLTEESFKLWAQMAAVLGDDVTLEIILRHAADRFHLPNWTVDGNMGQALLHDAVSRLVVQLLLKKGWGIDTPDVKGWTPAHSAALDGRTDEFYELILQGANLELKDKAGFTPLTVLDRVGRSIAHHAAENGPEPLLQWLVDNKVWFFDRDNSKKTALELAVDPALRAILIKDPTIKNESPSLCLAGAIDGIDLGEIQAAPQDPPAENLPINPG